MKHLQRRELLLTGAAAAAAPLVPKFAFAQAASSATSSGDAYYSKDEVLTAGSNFLGVTAESLGGAIEKIFNDYGDEPTAYVAGEEASGAVGIGLRYGKGMLYMKNGQPPSEIYWQGPSIGFDTGANVSRVFTLVYNLREPIFMYRRFPGVEGSAYFIGGLGVTYQRAEGIILAPIRAGVGFRLGANVGYMSFSKKRRIFPL
jgi:hypothetical protein